MDKATELEIRRRSQGLCEYCRLPEALSKLKFAVDHIIACQHGGPDAVENRALSCGFCNRHKGPNLAGIDRETGQLTRLFHPRQDSWEDHFRRNGAIVVGLTPVGRVTVHVLAINHPSQVAVRQALIEEGLLPPI